MCNEGICSAKEKYILHIPKFDVSKIMCKGVVCDVTDCCDLRETCSAFQTRIKTPVVAKEDKEPPPPEPLKLCSDRKDPKEREKCYEEEKGMDLDDLLPKGENFLEESNSLRIKTSEVKICEGPNEQMKSNLDVIVCVASQVSFIFDFSIQST